MIGACVSLILILASALLIGQALAAFAGGATRGRPAAVSWLAPAYGIAALLVLGGIAPCVRASSFSSDATTKLYSVSKS